jgi:energy-coupling factor transport system ATP-binding protein
VALVGRNGSGKTTLIKHFNRLLKPKRGLIKILGQEAGTKSVSELSRHVGFAWQNPNDQLFQANVRDEVLTGPRVLHALDRDWCDRLIERFERPSRSVSLSAQRRTKEAGGFYGGPCC